MKNTFKTLKHNKLPAPISNSSEEIWTQTTSKLKINSKRRYKTQKPPAFLNYERSNHVYTNFIDKICSFEKSHNLDFSGRKYTYLQQNFYKNLTPYRNFTRKPGPRLEQTVTDYCVYIVYKKKIVAIVNFSFFEDSTDRINHYLDINNLSKTLTNFTKDTIFIVNSRRIIGAVKSVRRPINFALRAAVTDHEDVLLRNIATRNRITTPTLKNKTLLNHYNLYSWVVAVKTYVYNLKVAKHSLRPSLRATVLRKLITIKIFTRALVPFLKKLKDVKKVTKGTKSALSLIGQILAKLKVLQFLIYPAGQYENNNLRKSFRQIRFQIRFPDPALSTPLRLPDYYWGWLSKKPVAGVFRATRKWRRKVKGAVRRNERTLTNPSRYVLSQEELNSQHTTRISQNAFNFLNVNLTLFLYSRLLKPLLNPIVVRRAEARSDMTVGEVSTTPVKLLFNFKKHYLFVTLIKKNFGRRTRGRVIFSLNTGLFLKFFSYKKSLKKSKSLKLLMMRYLRKLLIVSKLKSFKFYIKQTSDHLGKMINMLQKPLNHVFYDPLTGRKIDEESREARKLPCTFFNFIYIIFIKNKPYGKMKVKNEGRLKRKIRRRIIKMNRIID